MEDTGRSQSVRCLLVCMEVPSSSQSTERFREGREEGGSSQPTQRSARYAAAGEDTAKGDRKSRCGPRAVGLGHAANELTQRGKERRGRRIAKRADNLQVRIAARGVQLPCEAALRVERVHKCDAVALNVCEQPAAAFKSNALGRIEIVGRLTAANYRRARDDAPRSGKAPAGSTPRAQRPGARSGRRSR